MKQRLLLFTVLTFLLSWACWISILDNIESNPFESAPTVLFLFFLGGYAPTITGILLTIYYDGKDGIKAIKSRLKLKKADIKWIFISLIVAPVLYGITLLIYLFFDGQVGEVNWGLLPWIPVVFLVSIVFGPLAEEFGWRGFALPLLNPKANPITASLVIGVIWALWHAPLFWAQTGTSISGFDVTIVSVALFFIAIIGRSFIHTWVFNNTKGSIAMAILLHLGMNASGTIRGMLFPDMGMEQSFDFFKYHVVVLGCVALLFLFLFYRLKKKGMVVS